MNLYTITYRGKTIGCEFGLCSMDAIRRYAQGSIFAAADLAAVRGLRA